MMRYGMWLTQDKSTSQQTLGELGEQSGRDGNTRHTTVIIQTRSLEEVPRAPMRN